MNVGPLDVVPKSCKLSSLVFTLSVFFGFSDEMNSITLSLNSLIFFLYLVRCGFL